MFRLSVGVATVAFAINVSATTNLLNENFDAMDTTTGAAIGDWKFYDQPYKDAACTEKNTDAAFGPGSAENRNADPYFRANLEKGNDNAISGTSLRVYENTAYGSAANACQHVLIFKEFANGTFSAGNHTFKAKMMNQKYVTNNAASKQGMFAKVLDVGNGYNETVAKFLPIAAPDVAAEQTLSFVVPDMSGYSNGAILQVGFFAQSPTGASMGEVSSGAMWDDVTLDAESADEGGGDGGGDNGGGDNGGGDTPAAPSVPVPVMPLGGLLGLIALVGWLGLRRRG